MVWRALAFFSEPGHPPSQATASRPRLQRHREEAISGRKINRETDQHADARGAKTVLPTVNFAECAGDQRRDDDTRVDKDVVNLETRPLAGCPPWRKDRRPGWRGFP